jgi:hypothetical protein
MCLALVYSCGHQHLRKCNAPAQKTNDATYEDKEWWKK